MQQYGQQPGYPQQPQPGQIQYGHAQASQPGFQPPMGNQPPAYGLQQPFSQNPQPVRLTKGGIYEFGSTTEFSAILRWDGRGVNLSKVTSLPSGYMTPQQNMPFGAPPAYGQNPHQQHFPQQNPHQQASQFGSQPTPNGQVSTDDLDLHLFVVDGVTGRVLSDSAFVFFNNPMFQLLPGSPPVALLVGDNRTGNGEDDEIGRLSLNGLPKHWKIMIGASIYDPSGTKTFGTIKNAEICIVGAHGVAAEYDLDANVKTQAAAIFGEVLFDTRHGWHFCANPAAFANLAAMAGALGVNV